MVLAGAVTNAGVEGKRRAGQVWQARRDRAQQKARERAQRAQARAGSGSRSRERAAAWVDRNSRKPWHPVGVAYGLGWLASAAGGAAVAGVAGARTGGRDGARQGKRVGRWAARTGVSRAAAWAEYRRQRDADRDQRERAEGEPAQAGASADGSAPDPPPVWVSCRGCGAAITQHRAQAAQGLCPACLDPDPEHPAGEDSNERQDTNPDLDRSDGIEDAVVLEDLPACARCGRPVEGELYAADGGGICADCRQEVSDPEHDDSTTTTDQHTETEEPVSTPQTQMSLNGSALSGGDGEGYAGTVTALEQMSHLLEQVQQVSNDLGDQVTAKNIDAETISGLSRLSDHIEAAAGEAGSTLAHVQSKHSEVAAAVSGAGGSAEVADTDWYDQY